MRTKSIPTLILLVVAGLVGAGCLLPGEPEAVAPGTEQQTTAPDPQGTGSLEGAFTYATMDDYVEQITPYITQFVEDTWPNMPLPEVLYVPAGASGRESCTDQDGRQARYSSESYEYCPVDAAIYVGQDMLWEFYDRTGDAGPAVGLAHEFGHHIQSQLGVPTGRMSSVDIENQADCIAGAWTRYTDERGWLEREDDLQDIELLFPLIGSAEDPSRDHGTAQERAQSFESGFNNGVQACDL